MTPNPKARKVVILEREVVKVRAARKDGVEHYDPQLQDLFMEDGGEALRSVAMRHYHGFIRRGS